MIDVLNGKYIGYPCTPSEWDGKPTYKKISIITMSCGGGMGGSKWYEYVERIPFDKKLEGIQSFLTIDGKKVRLNPQYMVKITDYTLVTATYITTNSNFTRGKPSVNREIQFLINDDVEVELINDFADKAKKMNRGWL